MAKEGATPPVPSLDGENLDHMIALSMALIEEEHDEVSDCCFFSEEQQRQRKLVHSIMQADIRKTSPTITNKATASKSECEYENSSIDDDNHGDAIRNKNEQEKQIRKLRDSKNEEMFLELYHHYSEGGSESSFIVSCKDIQRGKDVASTNSSVESCVSENEGDIPNYLLPGLQGKDVATEKKDNGTSSLCHFGKDYYNEDSSTEENDNNGDEGILKCCFESTVDEDDGDDDELSDESYFVVANDFTQENEFDEFSNASSFEYIFHAAGSIDEIKLDDIEKCTSVPDLEQIYKCLSAGGRSRDLREAAKRRLATVKQKDRFSTLPRERLQLLDEEFVDLQQEEKIVATLQVEKEILQQKCLKILKGLQTHQHGWVFNEAFDPDAHGFPDYFDVVKKPMDLGTIQKKLETGECHTIREFQALVNLCFDNAMSYDEKGSVLYEMAKELKSKFEADRNELFRDKIPMGLQIEEKKMEKQQRNIEDDEFVMIPSGTNDNLGREEKIITENKGNSKITDGEYGSSEHFDLREMTVEYIENCTDIQVLEGIVNNFDCFGRLGDKLQTAARMRLMRLLQLQALSADLPSRCTEDLDFMLALSLFLEDNGNGIDEDSMKSYDGFHSTPSIERRRRVEVNSRRMESKSMGGSLLNKDNGTERRNKKKCYPRHQAYDRCNISNPALREYFKDPYDTNKRNRALNYVESCNSMQELDLIIRYSNVKLMNGSSVRDAAIKRGRTLFHNRKRQGKKFI